MEIGNGLPEKIIETDVLVLGSGASGCGAAIAAKKNGAKVLLIDKGKLESSGCLGGGNDHFMAVMNSGPESDTTKALVDFYQGSMFPLSPKMIKNGWAEVIPSVLEILKDAGLEFVTNDDGSLMRTTGFGQPGSWWINIRNGHKVKRLIASKVRSMAIDILDNIMVTKIMTTHGRAVGCVGFNVLDGTFYIIKAKKIIMALGNVSSRGWTNSSGNPYNSYYPPYNTGSQFVLSFETGVKLCNIDTFQIATMLPKGFGAPGMNGINSMGGHELNALGERFMFKYDPMGENGLRINQINGTYQELIEGKGPPFYMDMTHLDKEDVHHLQYVLMPGDKETYLDYCEQRGVEFSEKPLEVEISELSFGGTLFSYDNFETNVKGIYNGCIYDCFSSSMCGGYYAGSRAAMSCNPEEKLLEMDSEEIQTEKQRIFNPVMIGNGLKYKEFERAITQIMNYYVGYRRSRKGMEIALDRLEFVRSHSDQLMASDYRELMRVNESKELLRICLITIRACLERKESGRAYYRRSDYPKLAPELNKILITWQEGAEQIFSWGIDREK